MSWQLYLGNLALQSTALLAGLGLLWVCVVRRRSPAWRHGVLCGGLGLLLLLPLSTFASMRAGVGLLDPSGAVATVRPATGGLSAGAPPLSAAHCEEPGREPFASGESRQRAAGVPVPAFRTGAAGWLVGLWLLGALSGVLRVLLGLAQLGRLSSHTEVVHDGPLLAAVGGACAALGLRTQPVVRVCRGLRAPFFYGMRKPVIVFPVGLSDRLSPSQLEAVATHEAAHLVRGDPLAGILQQVAVALFWWQPLVHVFARHLSSSREELCDAYVRLPLEGRHDYALALLAVAESALKERRLVATVAATHSQRDLESRVRHLLGEEDHPMTTLTRASRAFLVAATLIGACGLTLLNVAIAQESTGAPTILEGRAGEVLAIAAAAAGLELQLPEDGDLDGSVKVDVGGLSAHAVLAKVAEAAEVELLLTLSGVEARRRSSPRGSLPRGADDDPSPSADFERPLAGGEATTLAPPGGSIPPERRLSQLDHGLARLENMLASGSRGRRLIQLFVAVAAMFESHEDDPGIPESRVSERKRLQRIRAVVLARPDLVDDWATLQDSQIRNQLGEAVQDGEVAALARLPDREQRLLEDVARLQIERPSAALSRVLATAAEARRRAEARLEFYALPLRITRINGSAATLLFNGLVWELSPGERLHHAAPHPIEALGIRRDGVLLGYSGEEILVRAGDR